MKFPSEDLLKKLWETLADKGMGSLLEPWQIRRISRANGEARRHEHLMLAQAERDANDVRAGHKKYLPDGTLQLISNDSEFHTFEQKSNRIEPTLGFSQQSITSKMHADAVRQEINQTKSILFAEEQLLHSTLEHDPSSKPVDDDWLNRWRESAGKTSNEDIQKLWGSVLAGEILSPGTFSLRTLEFLKGLSRNEAELIQIIAPFIWFDNALWRDLVALENYGITYEVLLDLQEIGILQGVESNSIALNLVSVYEHEYLYFLRCHQSALVFTHDDPKAILNLPLVRLTKIGREVIKLGSHTANIDFLIRYAQTVVSQGFKAEVGDYMPTPEEDTEFEYAAYNLRRIT